MQMHQFDREFGPTNPEDLTPLLRKVASAKNPDFAVTHVLTATPFRLRGELITKTVGRLYLREATKLIVVTASRQLLKQLRDDLTKALRR